MYILNNMAHKRVCSFYIIKSQHSQRVVYTVHGRIHVYTTIRDYHILCPSASLPVISRCRR